MKKIVNLIVLLSFFVSVNVYAKEKIPVKGDWGNEKKRPLTSACPVVYIDGNVLSIYLEDALLDLTVIITDNNGNIVYQNCISTTNNYETCYILLPSNVNSFQIQLIHHTYGYLIGYY